jgi:hypothetical protein
VQSGVKIKPVQSGVCRGLDTTSQVGWGKKKTRQIRFRRVSEKGGRMEEPRVRKTETYLITYVDKPSTKTQGQRREG